MVWFILIMAGMLICAAMAVVARRLLVSAIWLAIASALLALLIYLLGAPELAVIELSVGAGLVTVLFVFAISIAVEESNMQQSLLPKWLAGIVVLVSIGLTGWLCLPDLGFNMPQLVPTRLSTVLWELRGADVILQVILIFAGVLGVLGLLSDEQSTVPKERDA